MGFSFDEFKKDKTENKIHWNSDKLSRAGNDINDYLKGVQNQANFQGTRWTDDEFNGNKDKISSLRSSMNMLQAYANSVKDKDENAYRQTMSLYSQLGGGLDTAEKWFNDNSDSKTRAETWEKRKAQENEYNTHLAIDAMRGGQSTAAEQAQKYGLDEKELEGKYKEFIANEAKADLSNTYDSMSYDELLNIIFDPKRNAQRIVQEVDQYYKNVHNWEHNTEQDYESAFKGAAERNNLSVEQVKKIYQDGKNWDTEVSYQSYALSDDERDYIFKRMLETGNSQQLEKLRDKLPKAKYYNKIRSGLNEAIENKHEEESFLSYLEKYPDLDAIIYNYDKGRKYMPSGAENSEVEANGKTIKMLPSTAIRDYLLEQNSDYKKPSVNQIAEQLNLINPLKAQSDYEDKYIKETLRQMYPDADEKTINGIVNRTHYDADSAYESLKNEIGEDEFDKLVKYRGRYWERLKNAKHQEDIKKDSENFPILMSIASVPINMIGSATDLIRTGAASIDAANGGDGWYDPKATANYTAQNIRSTVGEKIDNPAGQFLYQTGMSMGDSAFAMAANAIPVAGKLISSGMFFSSAGVNAYNRVIENGGSNEQAAWTLVSQGAAELVFEKISLEKLNAFKASKNVKGIKDIVKNKVKQMFTEGSEEVATDVANLISDGIINGDLSEFQLNKQKYIDSGMSEGEANGAAVADFFKNLGMDFAGGALSGGVFGAAVSTYAHHNYNSAMKNTNVVLNGAEMSVKDAVNMSRDYFMQTAQNLEKSPDFNVSRLVETAKNGGEKAQKLAESVERTIKKSGSDAVTTADISNLLETIYKEGAESLVTGEGLKSAGVIRNIEQQRDTAIKREYNSQFDETGAAKEGGVKGGTTKAFGATHKNGIYATDKDGRSVVVSSIESSAAEYGARDNNVILKLDTGETVNASEVSIENPDYQRLVTLAPSYDTLGARALVANYEEAQSRGVSTDQYIEQFNMLYKMGRAGLTYETASKSAEFGSMVQSLGENVAQRILSAGNNDTIMHVRLEDMNLRRVKVPGQKTSASSRLMTDGGTEINPDNPYLQTLQAVAEAAGKDIILTDRLNSGDMGVYKDNRIYINNDLSEHEAVAVALHEAVHGARVYAPTEYHTLESFIINYLVENNQNVDKLLDNIAAVWGKDAASRATQLEELVANTVMALASDENAFTKAVETPKNKDLLVKVKEALKGIIDRVKEFFRSVDENGRAYGHNKQAQPWLDDVKALEQLADKFNKLVTAAKQNEAEYGSRKSGERFAKSNSSQNTFSNSKIRDEDIRYSKNDGFYFDEDEEFEQALWDDAYDAKFDELVKGESDEVNPDDLFGRTYKEIAKDELKEKDSRKIDVEKLLESDSPDMVVYRLYSSMSNMAERSLQGYGGIRLADGEFEKIAKRVMRNYDIHAKNFPEAQSEIAAKVKEFFSNVSGKKGEFSTFINTLAGECKEFLKYSGNYGKVDNQLAKSITDALRGDTILITPYMESEVLGDYDGSLKALRKQFKGYVNFALEKDSGKYKHPVYMEDVIDTIQHMTGSQEMYGGSSLFENGERPDSLDGVNWLANVIENHVRPKFMNPYLNGEYGENYDTAAMDMAFDIIAETMRAKAEKAAEQKSIDRKVLKELKENSQKALAERKAVYDAKLEKYNKQFNRMKERMQRSENKRALVEEDYETLKAFVRSDTKNYRRQYEQRVKSQNNIEAVKRQMSKLRTMIMNPTNEKFIPPEILKNKQFLDSVEALGGAITAGSRSVAAQKMQDMLSYVRKELRPESERSGGDFNEAFDEEFMASLQNVADWLNTTSEVDSEGNTKKLNRNNFSNNEIAELRQLVDEIVGRIEDSRKLLLRKDGMTAREASDKVIAQTREINGRRARKIFAGFSQEMMNPLRAVNLMANYNKDSELYKLFYALNEGQRKQWFWEMGAEKPFAELMEKHDNEFKKACTEIDSYDYFADGKEYHIKMTRMQALQVLMTWKRESRSNMNHMKRGGIVVADPKKVAKGKGAAWANARNVPVSSDLIEQIVKGMNDFENEYMRTAENYFNKVAKDAINETFLVTRHREVAKSEYYIPVRVDSDFSKAEIQSLKFDFTVEGAGSYKHIVPHAPQPIMIESLNSVIDRHILQTGKLYGLDIPLVNFKRMFKGTTNFSSEGSAWNKADSVKKALNETFGSQSVKYIEDTISALEAGRTREKSRASAVADFLYSKRVQTALVGNFGVVIKQAASYPTAGLYLSAKDLSVGLGKFFIGKKSDGKLSKNFYQKTVEEIDRYTAQHYQRRKGMSIQEVADTLNGSKLARRAPTAVNPAKWIQAMDCATTAALWEATKSHVNSEYKKNGGEIGSEKYWKEVASLYDTIIEDTQPMYDELHRSDFQKKSNSLKKFVFPFKTQPMQNMGILADAASEFVTKHDKESAVKLAKAVSSQVSSNIVFSLMTLMAAMLRHRADRYRDEDDKITFESAAPHIMWDMFSNGINAVAPIGGDWVIPAINDISDSVEKQELSANNLTKATEISLVNDWFTKFTKAANVLNDQLNGTNKAKADPWGVFWKVLDVPGSFSEIFGIPYSNLSLLFKGAYNNVKEKISDFPVNNYGELKTDNISNHILKAYESGNTERAEMLRGMWVDQYMSQGKTEDKAKDAVKNKLVVGVMNTEIAQNAAQAKYDGDLKEYKTLCDELKKKVGDNEIAETAVKKLVNKLKKGDSTDEDDDSGTGSNSSGGSGQEKSEYSYKDTFNALANGDSESYDIAKAELARVMVANGKAENTAEAEAEIDKKIKSFSYTKPLFNDYYSVSGERYKAAKEKLERIYGKELKKKYDEYVKKYIDKK